MKLKIAVIYTIMCLVWGSTWLAIKLGLEDLPPFLFAAFRFLIAVIIFGIILKLKGISLKLRKEDVKPVIFLALFAVTVPFALVYWGEQHTNSAMGAIFMGALPLAIFPISYLMRSSEQLSLVKFLGVMVGFGGLGVIFYPELLKGGGGLQGNIALFLAMLTCSVATIYLKKYAGHISIYKCVFYQMLLGGPLLLLFGLLNESPLHFFTGMASWRSLSLLFYLAIFGSIVAYLAFYYLIRRIGAVASTVSIFIEVVLAVLLDWLILAVVPHPYTWLGIVLIFAGIWLVMVGPTLSRRWRDKVLVEDAPAQASVGDGY